MKPLISLQNALADFGEQALQGGFAPSDELRRFALERERRYGMPDSDKPKPDRMEPALRRLLDSGEIESARDLRYICYGLAHPVGPLKQRVLASAKAFDSLFTRLHTIAGEHKRLRRCYQGLLSTYCEFDARNADEPMRGQWLEIRVFLDRWLNEIVSTAPVPQWAVVLSEHRNLLCDTPCKRYSKALLDGNSEEFDSTMAALSISDKSWVLQEGTFSAIQAACEERDSVFTRRIPALIDLMQKHPLIQEQGLIAVVSHYALIQHQTENKQLCEFSVGMWGNPLLNKNLKKWDLVGESATRMVAGWLKSRLIEDFFELLSVDGKTDRRRVLFWQRFIESIDDMYFALGINAYFRNNSEDMKRLRNTMGDHLLRLEGGSYTNNGFFMLMGDKVIAEFGEMGNAVYIFHNHKDSMPFELRGTIRGTGKTEWRELPGAHHLRHQDNVHNHSRWETRFDSYLSKKVGITPGRTPMLQVASTEKATTAPLPADADAIRKFCARYGIPCRPDAVRHPSWFKRATRIALSQNT